jgi:hypothetical protein
MFRRNGDFCVPTECCEFAQLKRPFHPMARRSREAWVPRRQFVTYDGCVICVESMLLEVPVAAVPIDSEKSCTNQWIHEQRVTITRNQSNLRYGFRVELDEMQGVSNSVRPWNPDVGTKNRRPKVKKGRIRPDGSELHVDELNAG